VTILFIARHFTYFRNFDSAIEALARQGHRVHLAADREDGLGGRGLVDLLAARIPASRWEKRRFAPGAATGAWRRPCGSASTTCATPTRASPTCRKSGDAPTTARRSSSCSWRVCRGGAC
jgi:hypothetical protein